MPSWLKRLIPWKLRRWLRARAVAAFPGLRYPWWIAGRVAERRAEYPAPPAADLFSLLTPVFDTPPRFLRELADSVLGQDYRRFDWVIVDNGSTRRDTRAVLERLAQDARVVLVRLPANRGIVAGTRAALHRARNRYVVPVDHDDRLYPDALRVLAWHLQAHGFPDAVYADEDKLTPAGRPWRPFCKPDWDPLLLTNCGYVAHLAALRRDAAEAVGAYTDPKAEGCPDLDAFLRLARAGRRVVHVPEVLYSWRMHAGSTADAAAGAKPYTVDCQYHALRQHLAGLGLADRLEVRTNPLFRRPGAWHVVRRHVPPAPPLTVLTVDGTARLRRHLENCDYPRLTIRNVAEAQLEVAAARAALRGGLVAVLHGDLWPTAADWPWEALGLFELLPDTAVVGGRILDGRGRVVSAGEVFGMGGILGCPYRGHRASSPARHGLLLCQRTVSAVDGGCFVARADFLAEALAGRPTMGRALRGAWLGAAARQQGLRVVYTPRITAQVLEGARPVAVSQEEAWAFLHEHWPLLLDDPYYARFCSLRPGRGFRLTPPEERAAVLNATLSGLAGPLPYQGLIKVDGAHYRGRWPVPAGERPVEARWAA